MIMSDKEQKITLDIYYGLSHMVIFVDKVISRILKKLIFLIFFLNIHDLIFIMAVALAYI